MTSKTGPRTSSAAAQAVLDGFDLATHQLQEAEAKSAEINAAFDIAPAELTAGYRDAEKIKWPDPGAEALA